MVQSKPPVEEKALWEFTVVVVLLKAVAPNETFFEIIPTNTPILRAGASRTLISSPQPLIDLTDCVEP